MKIGIILHPYGERNPAGLGRAVLDLTKALIKNDPQNEYIIFLKNKPKIMPEFSGRNWQVQILDKKYFWLDGGLRQAALADVYIFNTPILPFFYKPKKSIVIAYDFAYKYFLTRSTREYFQKIFLSWYHGFSLRRADKIIAVSQATKKDIIKFFKIPEEKIKVIYLGFDKKSALKEEIIKMPEKFFLFVGVIKERKNVLNMVKAFKRFNKKHPDYKLLLIGKGQGKYYEEIKKYVENERLNSEVIFFGYLNDGQLAYLYKRAIGLVFPSIIEGFGLPILEAMDCGLPVITSNVSSLIEIAGNSAALLVNPIKLEEIAEAMEQLIQNQELRKNLIVNGFIQAQKFSWDKTVQELSKIISSL